MPKISIIIPVYNGAKTIRETIESVLKQTFSDFDLIIINSESTDSTLEIVNQIHDPRIKVFSYPKANVAVNRNRGINHACGEFISFLDADDLWTPDKLASQYKALEENPADAVAYSWTDYIDESSRFLRTGSRITINGNVYAQLLLGNFLENGSNPLIRRQALSKVGGFDELLTNSQDRDMWLRLAAYYSFVAVPSPQILYRVLTNSMSTDVGRLEAASLEVLERAYKNAPTSLHYLKPYSIANLYKYLLYKTLEGASVFEKKGMAARFFCKAIATDPSLIKKIIILKAFSKLLIVSLLPCIWAKKLISNMPRIFNTSTLLGYIQLDISFIKESKKHEDFLCN
ncbi:MAG: glycosyltransferase [Scytonema sp. PMC 1069.18]|nr:glycosyltransferase [Scytonema sp. PMC 1069.18]MEC4887142.1 glycosyltransferase [Scytonema sp. PMC 1070.18]